MKSTSELLEKALQQQAMPYWTERLELARTTLHTAKVRGHLSPAIAGALAEELGENPDEWIVIAALESDKDSACKSRMIARIGSRWGQNKKPPELLQGAGFGGNGRFRTKMTRPKCRVHPAFFCL